MGLSRRGETDTIKLIMGIVLAAIIVVLLVMLVRAKLGLFNRAISECSGYCSDRCTDSSAGWQNSPGNEWCQNGVYDVSGTSNEHYKDKVANSKTKNAAAMPGNELGLKCCGLMPGKDPAPSFLGSELRINEVVPSGGTRRTDVTVPPSVVVYFGNNPYPIGAGQTITVYAGVQYNFTFRAKDARVCNSNPPGDICPASKVKEAEKYGKECVVSVNDDQGNTITDFNGNACTQIRNSAVENPGAPSPSVVQATFGNQYEGKALEGTVLLTKEKGRYDPSADGDFEFRFAIKVESPIQVAGLTPAYSNQKQIMVTCRDVECMKFFYKPVNSPTECKADINKDFEAQYPQDKPGIGIIKITEEAMAGKSVGPVLFKDKYLCIVGQAKDATTVFAYTSPFKLQLDSVKPRVVANFMPLDLATEVVCSDASGSGCKNEYCYHYIADPANFLGALATSVGVKGGPNNKADTWCPPNKNAYICGAESKLPYMSADEFKVLCVMVEDNAGNAGKDIVLAYQSYAILQKLLGGLQK